MRTTLLGGAMLVLAVFLYLNQAPAQTTAKPIVITIEDLDCPTCAKKVEKSVGAVGGVAAVKTDVKTMTATVTPEAGKVPSARDLWEAVEKAGFQPTKLEMPSATYTSKPGA